MNLVYALALASATLIATPVLADFGGGSSTTVKPAPTGRAVTESSFVQGERLSKIGRYAEAIPLLQAAVAEDSRNADALNALGFSYRKLGNHKLAFDYYRQALAVDPRHRGASEYLGELYLETGDLPRAEERLAWLGRLCPGGCEEKDDLAQAVAAYKKKAKP
ncbi:MAG: tetratricopeptide repeat protein [Azospirillum sp.]|nr:tetratricopeptide repeat protein [Azospirillum sp.]